MYYDIVNSGERIKELRAARRMTRQQLAEQIGLSVDALRKIEAGVNGAKIDTLISIAELVEAFVSEIVFTDNNIEVKLLYDDFLKELLDVAEEREVGSNG
ncbi:helix-turn-helix domain-containing protein [Roseburia sp. TF10-5]|uniref:helix-turn-helix domain-containing protein n=1 Tax=Roseburia sp. TF10-5 TaxID=2293144 RepID=UPI001FA83CDC|nr:helix-turn-helix transcriptional regulator [Roseburia sp. TF10-5]